MPSEIIHTRPEVFFREALEEAMQKESVVVSPSAHAYVVSVLVRQVHDGYHPDETLGDRFARALSATHFDRIRTLRDVGDRALIASGLWWERQYRPLRMSHATFHMDIGRRAYESIGGDPFEELSENIEGLVDALIRLGTDHSLKTARDVLRLYMLWQETRSRHAARALAGRGVMVVLSGNQRPS